MAGPDEPVPPATPESPTLEIPVRVELERESGDEGASPAEARAPRDRRTAGRYVVEEEIGRGGMGIVYRAFDRDLRRRVAMKVMLQGLGVSKELAGRFVEEAQATAQLQHPGIVPVYEIGLNDDGKLFFTMKLVRGRTLAEVLRASRAGEGEAAEHLSRHRLVQLFLEVARTVSYAHERGVIHRDLKPQNVMIGRYGEVQVMDWGLAKVLAQLQAAAPAPAEGAVPAEPASAVRTGGDRADTLEGAVVGTPAYMPPEQADGSPALMGPRADVYALGATLYHVLTGQAPFEGRTTKEVLAKVLTAAPRRPRELDASISRELEAICLRALAKAPEERYASARDLADDVQAWLEDEPVAALPEGIARRALRWMGLHRGLTDEGMVTLLLVVVGMSGWFAQVDAERRRANDARQQAERHRFEAQVERRRAELAAVSATALASEAMGNLAQVLFDRGDRAAADRDYLAAELLFARALVLSDQAGDAERARATRLRLIDARLHGARLAWTSAPLASGTEATLGADGRRIAVSSAGEAATVYDAASGRELASVTWEASPAVLSPDGALLALVRNEDIALVDLDRDGEVAWLRGAPATQARQPSPPPCLAFSADGRRLVASDGDVRIFDVAARRCEMTIGEDEPPGAPAPDAPRRISFEAGLYEARFTPDGTLVACEASDVDGAVVAFDLAAGKVVTRMAGYGAFALSADGKSVAIFRKDAVLVFALATGAAGASLPQPEEAGDVAALAWSPDGRRLATGADDGSVRIWDIARAALLREIPGRVTPNRSPVRSLAFFPAGDKVVACGEDRHLRILDAASGRELLGTPDAPMPGMSLLTFQPGGAGALAVRDGGVWGTVADSGPVHLLEPGGRVAWTVTAHRDRPTYGLSWTPDGSRLAICWGADVGETLVNVVDAWTAKEVASLRRVDEAQPSPGFVAFAADGARVFTGGYSGCRLYDLAAGTFVSCTAQVELSRICMSGDRRVFAALGPDDTIRIQKVAGGPPRVLRFAAGETPTALALDERGALLAAGSGASSSDGTEPIVVFDAGSGAEVFRLAARAYAPHALAVRPDGYRIASLGFGRDLRIWPTCDLDWTGNGPALVMPDAWSRLPRSVRDDMPDHGFVEGTGLLAWSADGRLLACARDRIEVWELSPGRESLAPSWSFSGSPSVSVDGRWMSAQTRSGTALFDLPSRRRIEGAEGGALSGDGRRIAVADLEGVRVVEREGGRPVAAFALPRGWGCESTEISLTLDAAGRRLAAAVSGTSILWDVDAQRRIARVEGSPLAWTPDGKRFVCFDHDRERVRLVDAETGREVAFIADPALTPILSCSVSADGRRVAMRGGPEGRDISVFDVASGARVRAIRSFVATDLTGGRSVALSADGSRVAAWNWRVAYPSGIWQNALLVWNADGGDLVVEVHIEDEDLVNGGGTFTSRGDLITTGNAVRIWDIARLEAFQRATPTALYAEAERDTRLTLRGIDVVPAPRERADLVPPAAPR